MEAVSRPVSPIPINEDTKCIMNAFNMLNVHKVLIIVSGVLVLLLPVYSKLLKKINTSIAVDDNGQMAAIEINE